LGILLGYFFSRAAHHGPKPGAREYGALIPLVNGGAAAWSMPTIRLWRTEERLTSRVPRAGRRKQMDLFAPYHLIVMPLILVIFFAPAIIAMRRHHARVLAIFMVNLLLGWTVVGWIVALVWSFLSPREAFL
jgi:Superinfection immunity protein